MQVAIAMAGATTKRASRNKTNVKVLDEEGPSIDETEAKTTAAASSVTSPSDGSDGSKKTASKKKKHAIEQEEEYDDDDDDFIVNSEDEEDEEDDEDCEDDEYDDMVDPIDFETLLQNVFCTVVPDSDSGGQILNLAEICQNIHTELHGMHKTFTKLVKHLTSSKTTS